MELKVGQTVIFTNPKAGISVLVSVVDIHMDPKGELSYKVAPRAPLNIHEDVPDWVGPKLLRELDIK